MSRTDKKRTLSLKISVADEGLILVEQALKKLESSAAIRKDVANRMHFQRLSDMVHDVRRGLQ